MTRNDLKKKTKKKHGVTVPYKSTYNHKNKYAQEYIE